MQPSKHEGLEIFIGFIGFAFYLETSPKASVTLRLRGVIRLHYLIRWNHIKVPDSHILKGPRGLKLRCQDHPALSHIAWRDWDLSLSQYG